MKKRDDSNRPGARRIGNGEQAPLLCDEPTSSSIRSVTPSENSTSGEPFNISPLISILLLTLVKPICYDIVLPFINRMIFELEIVDSPEKVGPYSGFLMSMFSVMVMISLLPWSFISDRFGRKPVILFGSSGMAISIALFGVSSSYAMMLGVICVNGILAGTTATLRVLLAETYPSKSHRISALAAQQIVFRVGQMTGDSLGGFLSHPERRFRFFDTPFWKTHPFSLPCFVASGFSCLASAYGVSVKETRHRIPYNDVIHDGDAESLLGTTSKPTQRSYVSILTPRVVRILLSIFLMAVSSETIFAFYPLLAFTPPPSGLGLSPSTIGFHMATRSALNIVVMCVAAPIQQRIGSVKTFKWGMACIGVAVLALWAVVELEDGVISKVFLATFLAFWGGGSLVWPSSQVILVESPKSPEDLALVVGLAQVVQWIGMALSPIFISNLFSFSISHHVPFFGRGLVYVVLLAISSVGTEHVGLTI